MQIIQSSRIPSARVSTTDLFNFHKYKSGWSFFEVEVKVWDGNAQVWSNVVTEEIELVPATKTNDNSQSETTISDWLLPIGLGIVVILILGYMVMTKKE